MQIDPHRFVILGSATIVALLIIHLPGLTIGVIREVCRIYGLTQHVADFFAWILAAAVAVFAGRFVKSRMHGPLTGSTRGTVLALGIGCSAGLACRSAVLIAQSHEFLLNPGVVGSVSALNISSLVTLITRFAIQSAFFEEAAVRGYLHFRIVGTWGPRFSIVYGALFTTAIHVGTDISIASFPIYLVMGALLGWIVQLTRSLPTVITFHFVFNVSGLLIELQVSRMFAPGFPLAAAYSSHFSNELMLSAFVVLAILTGMMLKAVVQETFRT